MTVANINEESIFDTQLPSINEDGYIDMLCTYCGYEEEASFLIDEGDPEPLTWQCPKCYNETLVRKPD